MIKIISDTNLHEMKLNEIYGLSNKYKERAIKLLIQSILDSTEHDLISYFESEIESKYYEIKDMIKD